MAVIIGGIYEHYKGNRYQVLGTARHSETEEDLVVYRKLYGDFSIWVRPAIMFEENVMVDNRPIPRFAYTGKREDPCWEQSQTV